MLFMMEWKIKDNCVEKSVNQFLNTGAPVPENSTLIGRYHAPGSVKGWLIVETDDLNTIYKHQEHCKNKYTKHTTNYAKIRNKQGES